MVLWRKIRRIRRDVYRPRFVRLLSFLNYVRIGCVVVEFGLLLTALDAVDRLDGFIFDEFLDDLSGT